MAKTLSNLAIGATARVLNIDSANAAARRLMEMGVIPGTAIRLVKSAPFGDPIQVQVRNSHLAVRRSEAEAIFIAEELAA